MTITLSNRTEAGQLLAQKLQAYTNCSDGIVLALPRGGVPVGYEIAKALNLPFDICLVRKLGIPHHPELAMGAIAPNGVRVLNYDILSEWGIPDKIIDKVSAKELRELRRREYSYLDNTCSHCFDATTKSQADNRSGSRCTKECIQGTTSGS